MTMHGKILAAMRTIEAAENVKIIFAVEAGSRAWGFESPDSDWDVRFVYVRPRDWYLTMDEGRDVIDGYHKQPYIAGTQFDDPLMDITGWDIRKTMQMLRKSNPQLLEWIHSPSLYISTELDFLTKLALKSLNMLPVVSHYRAMARGNFREYLQGEMVRYKKYLYVIRPLLAAKYAVTYNDFPHVDFADLLQDTLQLYPNAAELRAAIDRLLEVKMRSNEVDEAPRDPVLHAWIEQEIKIKEEHIPDGRGPITDYLNSQLIPLINTYDTTWNAKS